MQNAFGLARRSGSVKNKQRVLRIEVLGRCGFGTPRSGRSRGKLSLKLIPPEVTARFIFTADPVLR